MKDFFYLILDASAEMLRGPRIYKAWVGFLLLLIVIGCWSYYQQLTQGLVVTNMTNQVSWGF